ncbi:DUF1801 domain-containing protein [Ferruginibacter sp. HRS2-29]|uniref:DUF1801 domain-containing protein n=1 Tax=Ferruginibacter sp. HRS2-29 TaxID=2487334 RepID=UPI0020CE4EF8|nr:DUF1801 domain-containing protein [Ferruginibacter sp. HRS2-29]MCP9749890.1 DUF1801 domain-containing protein [Ferruginibacter sp. HRS2-29]
MASNKTTETNASVPAYVAAIADEARRTDIAALIKLMQKASGFPPKMWGPGIVGFGSYHYKYDSGHEGDAPLAGLASRSTAIVLYLNLGEKRDVLLEKLGKHKTGKGCIYLKKLADADEKVLEEMVKVSISATY